MDRKKVEAYFKRIGLEMPENIVPNGALLRKLQFAHCTTVPYENLDILRGVSISLDMDDVYNKVVERGRGGYCFELNGLFAWLLKELGYGIHEYAARYLRGESSIPMRRHRVFTAEGVDGTWLCDVGIGEVCPRDPIKMELGTVQEQFGESYRLRHDDFLGYVLEDLHKGEWRDFYSFTDELQIPEDYVAVSFYCEQHKDSPFNKKEMFSLKTSQGRITLDGNIFKEFTGDKVTVKELLPEEMPAAYMKFGLSAD